MSIDKYFALVVLPLWGLWGCDADNTPGASFRSGGNSQGTRNGIATEPAPNTATEGAPNTATEGAPNTATESARNTATDPGTGSGQEPGPVAGSHDCMTVCNHVTQMGCTDEACSETCGFMAAIPNCAAEIEGLLACASAAADCDALDGCDAESDALDDCASGDIPTTTTPTSPSISDPLNCNITDTCMGCVGNCDLCLCAGQYAGATSSDIALACSADCSSG